jgi:predicted transcriptional regulator
MNDYELELEKIGVHKVMTKEVIAANPNNKFSQIFQFFSERNVNHIPVCVDGVVQGIISNKDLMRALYKHVMIEKQTDFAKLDETVKLSDIMSINITTIDANKSLLEVRELFYKSPWNCLPVTHEGKMVGIITPKDFVKMRVIHIDGSDYGGY